MSSSATARRRSATLPAPVPVDPSATTPAPVADPVKPERKRKAPTMTANQAAALTFAIGAPLPDVLAGLSILSPLALANRRATVCIGKRNHNLYDLIGAMTGTAGRAERTTARLALAEYRADLRAVRKSRNG